MLFLLIVGSLLGLGRVVLSLALFSEVCLPGGVVVDEVECLDVVVKLSFSFVCILLFKLNTDILP